MQRVMAALLLMAMTAGCAPRAPGLETLSAEEAVAVLRMRARGVETVGASGRMALTSESGERIALDFGIRAEAGRFRLRAWRFGEAALDVTSTEDGAWVYAAREEDAARLPDADQFASAWELISGRVLSEARVTEVTPGTLTVAASVGDAAVRCRVDRAWLRPVEYRAGADSGVVVRIEPADWVSGAGESSALSWPRRVRLEAAEGEIDLRFERVEMNIAHPEGAFAAPARAMRQR